MYRLIHNAAVPPCNLVKDWKNPVRDTEEYRDSILEILSDARVVAPVIQMADFHSAIRQRSYFYVFTHQTTNGDYPQVIRQHQLDHQYSHHGYDTITRFKRPN